MVAGIVLVALGMKKTLGHVEEPLEVVPAFALVGGLAGYLLAHVSFRYRHIRTVNTRRTLLALILLALLPAAIAVPALALVTIVTVLVWLLVAYETRGYGESRARVRPRGARAGGGFLAPVISGAQRERSRPPRSS